MSNSALKREQLARNVHRSRVQRTLVLALEAEMVVSMADLRCATRLDDVDLSGDAICWTQPGGTHQGQPRVGVISDERFRVQHAVFLERVPDARISAAGREVVALGTVGGGSSFGGNDVGEDGVDASDEVAIREERFQDEDAGAGEEDVVPFVLEAGRGFCVGVR